MQAMQSTDRSFENIKMTKNRTRKDIGGFTLVEIMIVVAIIALLAAIAVPNFLRARKRSQATRILEDLRMVDAACDQYAIETNKTGGAAIAWSDIQNYLKTGSVPYSSGGKDLFGNAYSGGIFSVDSVPKLSSTTFNQLSDVAPSDFWSPFYP
jgi:prepilin-type N-terminal cleavage/methylation domain-containing protein